MKAGKAAGVGSSGAGGAHILPPDVYMGLEFGQGSTGPSQAERAFLNVYDINDTNLLGEITHSIPQRAPITQQPCALDMQGRPIAPQPIMNSSHMASAYGSQLQDYTSPRVRYGADTGSMEISRNVRFDETSPRMYGARASSMERYGGSGRGEQAEYEWRASSADRASYGSPRRNYTYGQSDGHSTEYSSRPSRRDQYQGQEVPYGRDSTWAGTDDTTVKLLGGLQT